MKKNMTLFLLLIVGVIYAQKTELKVLKKNLKSGNYKAAQSVIEQYKGVFAHAQAKEKQKFTLIKAETYYNLAKENIKSLKCLDEFYEAYKQLQNPNADIDKMRSDLLEDLRKNAVKSYENKNNPEAVKHFEYLYRLNPNDTLSLYNAASIAVSDSSSYDTALKHYKTLLDVNYDGAVTDYTALSNQTGNVENFPSKEARDLSVKLGTHKDPKEQKQPSKKSEIIKNIALILVQQGKREEALKAIDEAVKSNPGNQMLILSKADIYYKMERYDEYEKAIHEAISRDPDNPDLYYNVGVAKSNNKQYNEAVKYYQKALDRNPAYLNAALNSSSAYLELGNIIVNDMNEVSEGKSKKVDWDKYDKLKEKRENYYRDGAKVLEDFLKKNGADLSVLKQLKNIYGALGDEKNFKRIKSMLGSE